MAYVENGARIGRDNRAAGSPAGKENLVNQVFSPAPLRPLEIGPYSAARSVTSITRSGTTATVTCTAHGIAVGEKFRIVGAVQGQYNGEHRAATVADANTITYTVYGSPATTATGTITLREVRTAGIGD
jgi:hypothetical protein